MNRIKIKGVSLITNNKDFFLIQMKSQEQNNFKTVIKARFPLDRQQQAGRAVTMATP